VAFVRARWPNTTASERFRVGAILDICTCRGDADNRKRVLTLRSLKEYEFEDFRHMVLVVAMEDRLATTNYGRSG